MLNRITLLRVATALLYMGPLLAGLSGAGWAIVPIFVALFLLWIFFLRPELSAAPSWLPRLQLILVQTLLVTVFFGVGRGIAGVAGFPLVLPIWTTVSLSVLAILLGRLMYNPASLPPEPPQAAPAAKH
jgi:hypothetical protein